MLKTMGNVCFGDFELKGFLQFQTQTLLNYKTLIEQWAFIKEKHRQYKFWSRTYFCHCLASKLSKFPLVVRRRRFLQNQAYSGQRHFVHVCKLCGNVHKIFNGQRPEKSFSRNPSLYGNEVPNPGGKRQAGETSSIRWVFWGFNISWAFAVVCSSSTGFCGQRNDQGHWAWRARRSFPAASVSQNLHPSLRERQHFICRH